MREVAELSKPANFGGGYYCIIFAPTVLGRSIYGLLKFEMNIDGHVVDCCLPTKETKFRFRFQQTNVGIAIFC
jgi:hypothetical protein